MLPFKNLLEIDQDSNLPVYVKIANAIIALIAKGILAPEVRLPSTRSLAEILIVHRKTIVAAYSELEAQGWIITKGTSGTYVSPRLPLINIQKDHHRAAYKSKTKEEELTYKYMIDDGHPDNRLAPIASFKRSYSALFNNKNFIKKLGYSQYFKGDLGFRKELAVYLRNTRGIYASPSNILTTRGSIHSMYLVLASLLGSNKTIAAGHPGYGTIGEIAKRNGINQINIPVDEKGISVQFVEELCKKQQIDMVFVIPHHHYPTTVTLAPERRIRLVELAKEFNFLIMEDDYDYDFHYSGGPVLPLASLDHDGKVIYIGSFSKTIVPAIRMGFMVADENLIEQVAGYRRYVDRNNDLILEKVLLELLRFGELARHNKKAIKNYKVRRDIMHAAFQERFSSLFDYKLPEGGMAFWITLKKEVDHELVLQRIKEKSIRFDRYRPEGFRVGFAAVNESEIKERVELLAYLFEPYL